MKKKAKKTDATDRLHKAVADYVEEAGGRILVTGPIQIQRWPDDFHLNWTLAIKCTGNPPVAKDLPLSHKATRRK